MVSKDPAIPLQRGLYSLLSGDTALLQLVTGVFDEPPEDQPYDFLLIGPKQSIPENTHTSLGRQNVIQFDTYTRARSSAPGDAIGARLVELLHQRQDDINPLVDGHVVWKSRWEWSQSLDDPDREIRHRIDRFRIHTSQLEE